MAQRRPSRRSGGPGYRKRRINFREPAQRFLIVCEGERTEPNYFINFRVPKVVIHVKGFGLSPLDLVRRAEKERLRPGVVRLRPGLLPSWGFQCSHRPCRKQWHPGRLFQRGI